MGMTKYFFVVGRAEETSTYSSLGFCTVNCRATASNYQLSHLRPCREPNSGLRGGRRECYHSATMARMGRRGSNLFHIVAAPINTVLEGLSLACLNSSIIGSLSGTSRDG